MFLILDKYQSLVNNSIFDLKFIPSMIISSSNTNSDTANSTSGFIHVSRVLTQIGGTCNCANSFFNQ